MPFFLTRRARGSPIIFACLILSLITYYKPIHKFYISKISKGSYQYFNHTKELLLPGNRGQIFIPGLQNEVPISCPEPSCPPQRPCLTPTLNTTVTKACTCPTIPSPTSIPFSERPTIEQQTIAKLREEGIVIIFKTGAQEISQLAIHLGTTLRYLSPSDILFFSDLQGSLGPFLIHDALRNVDELIRDSNPDFDIYRKIQEYQSTGQDILELKEDRSIGDGRGGWILDKYKFIHMVEETFEMRPDAKWYVFIETDSYIVWPNLVAWLSTLDSKKPWYMGSAVWTGMTSFAHGGSGYILSNAAMNKLLGPDQPLGLARSWDSRMTSHCCGDVALGIALEEKGVKLTGARPFLNGYKPATFTYGEHWCQPVVVMHHLTSQEVSELWRFERKRELMGVENVTTFSELYEQFVEPHLMEERDNWDNLSHGQEFNEPAGWDPNAEDEEFRKLEEERIREVREKIIAEMMEMKKLEEEGKNISDEDEKSSNEDESHDDENFSTEEERTKLLIEKIMKQSLERQEKDEGNQDISEEEERVREEQLKQLIEGLEKTALTGQEKSAGSEEESGSKTLESGDAKNNEQKEKGIEILRGKAKGKGKKKQNPHQNDEAMKGEEAKPDSEIGDKIEKVRNGGDLGTNLKTEKEKDMVDSNEGNSTSKDGKNEKPEAGITGTEEIAENHSKAEADNPEGKDTQGIKDREKADDRGPKNGTDTSGTETKSGESIVLAPVPTSSALQFTSTSPPPTKRLMKRQDSLADADPGLNSHPQWRPFSPERDAFQNFENCRRACVADAGCFQFVHYEHTCKLSTSFRLGAYKAPDITEEDGQVTRNVTFKSGWMVKRIREWTAKNACKEPEWPVVEF